MSMHKNFMDIYNVLNEDEELLRLLYYPAANIVDNIPDPLDDTLPNVTDIDTDWTIRLDRIKLTRKVSDLSADTPICRIVMYAGNRYPEGNSYLVAEQELKIGVFVHESFENADLRTYRINDRLNQILALERITGMAKMEYVRGLPILSPEEYIGYEHTYKFWSSKK